MRPTRTFLIAAALALAVLIAAGAAIAKSVFDRTAERESFAADVAERLGVSVDELNRAFRDAALARVDRLLADGSITGKQAEKIRSRIDAGGPFAGGPGLLFGPGPGLRGHRGHRGLELGAAADYLGLSAPELREALRGGSSLAQVAERQGKAVDGLKRALLEAAKARLDAAEDAGRITPELKQRMLERLAAKIDRKVEKPGLRARGLRGGPGMRRP